MTVTNHPTIEINTPEELVEFVRKTRFKRISIECDADSGYDGGIMIMDESYGGGDGNQENIELIEIQKQSA